MTLSKQMHSNKKREILVYVVLWIIMFLAPVVSMRFHHAESEEFPWNELLSTWLQMLSLCIAFLVHNFLLAPLLVYKQRRLLYFGYAAALAGCFAFLQCMHTPKMEGPRSHEMVAHRHSLPDDGFAPLPPFEDPSDGSAPDSRLAPPPDRPSDAPPVFFGQHDIISTVILVMMLGMNLGVKLYFKQREDEERLSELERENLQQQLEYLRYQINPHFLMNTLNNIHALVDIDGEKAKDTIVELSKMLRYALYEGAQQRVELQRDVEFLKCYIELMRLRYTDKVEISIDQPKLLPKGQVPPMVFITFVENAFKHGVTYQQQSFVRIAFAFENGKVLFTCCNSKVKKEDNPHANKLVREGGVGLQNVMRRLQLLYGDNYDLNIDDGADVYNIKLKIPLS